MSKRRFVFGDFDSNTQNNRNASLFAQEGGNEASCQLADTRVNGTTTLLSLMFCLSFLYYVFYSFSMANGKSD